MRKIAAASKAHPDHTILEILYEWIEINVTAPIQGFEHKKNQDGTGFSVEQQVAASKTQIKSVANYLFVRGKSQEEIMDVLNHFKK